MGIGTVIDVSFDLSDGEQAIKARSRVVWSAPMMESGVEFTELQENDRVRIKFFVGDTFFSDN